MRSAKRWSSTTSTWRAWGWRRSTPQSPIGNAIVVLDGLDRVRKAEMSERTFAIITPVDDSVYVERPLTNQAAALAAVDQAAAAQQQWRQVPLTERVRILSAAVDNIVTERDA